MNSFTQSLNSRLVSFTSPGSFAAEQYQGLRLTIERLTKTHGPQVLAVTSPAAGEGKTLTAINLAGALARESDGRVLLIDADLRRPAVATTLGLSSAPGLADLLASDDLELSAVAQRVRAVSVVGGRVRARRARRFTGCCDRRGSSRCCSARGRSTTSSSSTRRRCCRCSTRRCSPASWTSMLVVVAANQTPRKLLGEALNLVDPAKVMGIVFNRDDRPLFGYYDEYYREYFPDASGAVSQA